MNLELMFDKFGRIFDPDQIIFCEYEPGDDFYMILNGQVKILKTVGDSIKTMDILDSGDIFGEMSLLEGQPRSATVVAVSEVRTLNFNRENFDYLMNKTPQIAFKLLTLFSTRIYDQKRRLQILMFDDVVGKVADVLLMLSQKQNVPENGKNVVIQITQEDIASWCGQPLFEVQKAVAVLSKGGRIDFQPDKVVIHSMQDIIRTVLQKRKEKK